MSNQDDLEILSVKNLIPVEIIYKLDGKEEKIVAHVDYNSKELVTSDLPQDVIEDKFFDFIYKSMTLPSDIFAEVKPKVPEVPKEEDVQW